MLTTTYSYSKKYLIRSVQTADPLSQRLIKEARNTKAMKARESYMLSGDLLMYKDRVYVPQQRSLIFELMSMYHDRPEAGHWGMKKTLELLKRKFKWNDMKADVDEYVRTSSICQGLSAHRHKPYRSLQLLPQPTRPWAEIAIDWITGLPPSERSGKEYNSILTIVDRYIKMALFIPVMDTMDVAEMAEVLYNELECSLNITSGLMKATWKRHRSWLRPTREKF